MNASNINTDDALAVVAKLDAGASLAEVLKEHKVEVEVEVFPGLIVKAVPQIDEAGRAHLSGSVSHNGREYEYHVSAAAEDVETEFREAVANNLPLRLATWWKSNFTRTPRLSRVIFDGKDVKKAGAMGPKRLIRRSF